MFERVLSECNQNSKKVWARTIKTKDTTAYKAFVPAAMESHNIETIVLKIALVS